MYHKCQLACYSLSPAKLESCLKECKYELDDFYRLKNKTFPKVQEVFLGPSSISP